MTYYSYQFIRFVLLRKWLLLSCLVTLNASAWEFYRFDASYNYQPFPAESANGVAQFEFPYYLPGTENFMAGALTTTDAGFTGDLRGKTITLRVSLATNGSPDFVFGGEVPGWNIGSAPPHFRMFITSANGSFSVSQSNLDPLSYWWCRTNWVSLDLLAGDSYVEFSVNVGDSLWSAAHNQLNNGEFAADFQNCLSEVKQIGVMFGGGSFFDVGCAVMPNTGTATFTLESFELYPPVVVPREPPTLTLTPGLLTVHGSGNYMVERSQDLIVWVDYQMAAGGSTVAVAEGFYRARTL